MFRKIIAFIKNANWICKAVTTVVTGLVSAKVIGQYVISELEGSELGEKLDPYIQKYIGFVDSIMGVAQKIAKIVCGSEIVIAQNISLNEALANLDKVDAEINKL